MSLNVLPGIKSQIFLGSSHINFSFSYEELSAGAQMVTRPENLPRHPFHYFHSPITLFPISPAPSIGT